MTTVQKPNMNLILSELRRINPLIRVQADNVRYPVGEGSDDWSLYDIREEAPRNTEQEQNKFVREMLQKMFGDLEPVRVLNYESSDSVRKLSMSREDLIRVREPMPNGTRPNLPESVVAAAVRQAIGAYRRWNVRAGAGWDSATVQDLAGLFVLCLYEAYLTESYQAEWSWQPMIRTARKHAWKAMHDFVRGGGIYRTKTEGGKWICRTPDCGGKPHYPPMLGEDGQPITYQTTDVRRKRSASGRVVSVKRFTRTKVRTESKPVCSACGGAMYQGWTRMNHGLTGAELEALADAQMRGVDSLLNRTPTNPAIVVERADTLGICWEAASPELRDYLMFGFTGTETERNRQRTHFHRLLTKARTAIRESVGAKRATYIPQTRDPFEGMGTPIGWSENTPRNKGPKAKRMPFCDRDENLTEYERRLKDLRMRPNRYLADGTLEMIIR